MQQKIKINIIGAGISGLSAGSYLQMNGFETQIFEKHKEKQAGAKINIEDL